MAKYVLKRFHSENATVIYRALHSNLHTAITAYAQLRPGNDVINSC